MNYFYLHVKSGYRIYPVILLLSILMLIFSCSSPESINAKADPLNAIPADQMDPVVLTEKIRENKFSPDGYEALFTHGPIPKMRRDSTGLILRLNSTRGLSRQKDLLRML